MNEETLNKYIDVAGNVMKFIDRKQYYQNGIRLKTQLSVNKFVHKWNNWRYDKNPESPFKD